MLRSQAFFYEHGENAGHLLAHQLKAKSSDQLISIIRKTPQELTIDPKEINNTFKTFYSELYTSEFPEDTSSMLNFLETLNTPTIAQEQRDNLERPLNRQEVENSIKDMQSGKAPGPDGFPVEFSKKLSLKLIPLLLTMFKYFLLCLRVSQRLSSQFY